MSTANRQISTGRKNVYYCGLVLTILGALSFLSTFVTFFANFGNFDNFEAHARSGGFRALAGMVLLIVGSVVMNIGRRGLAGSGILLDPEQTRRDVEPWNRMAGGMVNDALSEIGVVKKLEDHLDSSQQQVRIRCQACQSLNDETAKFCSQCGAKIC